MKGGADIADCKLYDNKSNNNRQFSLLSSGILSSLSELNFRPPSVYLRTTADIIVRESEGGKL